MERYDGQCESCGAQEKEELNLNEIGVGVHDCWRPLPLGKMRICDECCIYTAESKVIENVLRNRSKKNTEQHVP